MWEGEGEGEEGSNHVGPQFGPQLSRAAVHLLQGEENKRERG